MHHFGLFFSLLAAKNSNSELTSISKKKHCGWEIKMGNSSNNYTTKIGTWNLSECLTIVQSARKQSDQMIGVPHCLS